MRKIKIDYYNIKKNIELIMLSYVKKEVRNIVNYIERKY